MNDALSWAAILGRIAAQLWPVWAALIVTFILSIRLILLSCQKLIAQIRVIRGSPSFLHFAVPSR